MIDLTDLFTGHQPITINPAALRYYAPYSYCGKEGTLLAFGDTDIRHVLESYPVVKGLIQYARTA